MAELYYKNRLLQLMEGESILDCLLRHHVDYPHSCRSGICQACLIKTTDNSVESNWQEGLPDTLIEQGYFLACQAKSKSNLKLLDPDVSECEQPAIINELTYLNYNVVKVGISTEHLEKWTPGQFLNLINPEGISRSYSIANIPAKEGYIELNIKLKDGGEMSRWIQEAATINLTVNIRGPFGKCYYLNPDQSPYDIFLVGTGTGLAPLLAIAKTALSEHHQGKITILHGGCHDDDMYYSKALRILELTYNNFHYIPCVLKSKGLYPEESIFDAAIRHLPSNVHNLQVFVCGPKETTNKIKTTLFIAGMPSTRIFSDAF